MGDFDTRETLWTLIETNWQNMYEFRQDASTANNVVGANYESIVDPSAQWCVKYLYWAMGHIISCFLAIDGHDSGYDPKFAIPYFLKNYTIETAAEPTPLTWEDIVEAWAAASLDGVKFTISMLDYMREAIWDEPYNAKFYKPATEFWT